MTLTHPHGKAHCPHTPCPAGPRVPGVSEWTLAPYHTHAQAILLLGDFPCSVSCGSDLQQASSTPGLRSLEGTQGRGRAVREGRTLPSRVWGPKCPSQITGSPGHTCQCSSHQQGADRRPRGSAQCSAWWPPIPALLAAPSVPITPTVSKSLTKYQGLTTSQETAASGSHVSPFRRNIRLQTWDSLKQWGQASATERPTAADVKGQSLPHLRPWGRNSREPPGPCTTARPCPVLARAPLFPRRRSLRSTPAAPLSQLHRDKSQISAVPCWQGHSF